LVGGYDNQKSKAKYFKGDNYSMDEQIYSKMSTLFSACMNVTAQTKAGLTPLIPIIKKIKSMAQPDNIEGGLSGNNWAELTSQLEEWGVAHFFWMTLDTGDFEKPEDRKRILALLQGGYYLPSPYLYKDSAFASTYLNIVASQLQLVLGGDRRVFETWGAQDNSSDYYQKMAFRIVWVEAMLANWTQQV
jgi:predicted metalloendopeptidase